MAADDGATAGGGTTAAPGGAADGVGATAAPDGAAAAPKLKFCIKKAI